MSSPTSIRTSPTVNIWSYSHPHFFHPPSSQSLPYQKGQPHRAQPTAQPGNSPYNPLSQRGCTPSFGSAASLLFQPNASSSPASLSFSPGQPLISPSRLAFSPRPSRLNIGDSRSILSLSRFYLGDSQRPAGAGRVTCGRGSLAMSEQKTGIAPSKMDAKVLRPPAPASYSLVQHSAASPSLLSQPSKAAPESGLPKESTAVHAVGSCLHRCLRHLAGLYATEQLSRTPFGRKESASPCVKPEMLALLGRTSWTSC